MMETGRVYSHGTPGFTDLNLTEKRVEDAIAMKIRSKVDEEWK